MAALLRIVATYTGLFVAGEIAAQKTEEWIKYGKTTPQVNTTALPYTVGWGVVGGTALHHWYGYLDGGFKKHRLIQALGRVGRFHPAMKATTGVLCAKIIADLAFDAPLYGAYTYGSMVYHDKEQKVCQPSFPQTFKPIYVLDLAFWTPANAINFFLVPPQYRILFVSAATAGWATILPAHDLVLDKIKKWIGRGGNDATTDCKVSGNAISAPPSKNV